MDIHKTIKVLEALASGCSPTTGEVISSDSVLNERDVIRALETALFHLTSKVRVVPKEVHIDNGIIEKVIQLFKEQGRRIGSNNLVEFFLGTRSFKNLYLISSEYYGKYKDVYSKGELTDFFTKYLFEHNIIYNKYTTDKSFKNSDFFEREKFKNLTENDIERLKQKVNEFGILKTEDLPESVLRARKTHARAYEHWSEGELELLRKAIKYTNDSDLLSECFQRGKGSIESCALRLLYESEKATEADPVQRDGG